MSPGQIDCELCFLQLINDLLLWLFQGDGSLSINAKGGDATLVSNLLDEVKAFL